MTTPDGDSGENANETNRFPADQQSANAAPAQPSAGTLGFEHPTSTPAVGLDPLPRDLHTNRLAIGSLVASAAGLALAVFALISAFSLKNVVGSLEDALVNLAFGAVPEAAASAVGIVLGIVALKRSSAPTKANQGGRRPAIAGIAVGAAVLRLAVVGVIFFLAGLFIALSHPA